MDSFHMQKEEESDAQMFSNVHSLLLFFYSIYPQRILRYNNFYASPFLSFQSLAHWSLVSNQQACLASLSFASIPSPFLFHSPSLSLSLPISLSLFQYSLVLFKWFLCMRLSLCQSIHKVLRNHFFIIVKN